VNNPLKIAIAGLGTVGAGALSILSKHANLLASRSGRALQVAFQSTTLNGLMMPVKWRVKPLRMLLLN
jgi:homoserine dehydrogenase